MHEENLKKKTVAELRQMAEEQGLELKGRPKKQDYIDALAALSDADAPVAKSTPVPVKKVTPRKAGAKTPKKVSGKSSQKVEAETSQKIVAKSTGDAATQKSVEASPKETVAEAPKKAIDAAPPKAVDEVSKKAPDEGPNKAGEFQGRNHTPYQKKHNPYRNIKDNIADTVELFGPVEIMPEGFGLIKTPEMKTSQEWVYVSASQVQKFRLVTGDILGGKVRAAKPGEKHAAMLFLENVNGTTTTEIIEKINSLLYKNEKKDLERYKQSHEGILELNAEGFGFLRTRNYLAGDGDIYVAANQIRRFNLRSGDKILGKVRMPNEGEKYDALLYVERVNGDIPERIKSRPRFERLTPVFPDDQINLETDRDVISTRIIDVFSPLGKGQRGMIVAPPKAGKTTLLKEIARGITTNHPDIELIILLVDERPEEVTDIQRSVEADIVYSTFDQQPENHIRVAEIVLERGKRLVEQGKDAVILVDSLTRLTRANNLVVDPSGRTLSGGLDPESLYFPKKFFGSARNIEGGGSLTIIATALVETGSRMDDIIYEEFKGTGNMELHLERELAERRIFPAMNLHRSGTRREDKLLSDEALSVSFRIRKTYGGISAVQLTDKMINTLIKTGSNEEFLKRFMEKSGE